MSEIYIIDVEAITNSTNSYDQLGQCFTTQATKYEHNDNYFTKKFGARYIKKIDSSVLHLLYAGENLLNKVKLSASDLNNTGICLGNNFAGWSYVENQMYGLYQGNPDAINPYVATAWFPAAAQGEYSIRNKIFSHSKTFSCDQLSSAVALEYGVDLLLSNQIEYLLVGGHEALLSPLVVTALEKDNLVSKHYIASQAASMLLLSSKVEEKYRAKAKLLYINKAESLVLLLNQMNDDLHSVSVDYCLMPPLNIVDKNKQLLKKFEHDTIQKYIGNQFPIEMPTYKFGETGGASFALQLATAVWMLDKNEDVNNPLQKKCSNILLIGRDYYAECYYAVVVTNNMELVGE